MQDTGNLKLDTLLESRAKSNGYIHEPTRQIPQYIAAGIASIVLMIAGTVLGWTSPILPKLLETDAFINVTEYEAAWIGSLVPLGSFVGPFAAGIFADLIGRKKALLAAAFQFLAAWCILSVAQSVEYIYIGRLICGFAGGWGMTVLPMYIGEIATPNARGALGVLGQIMITLGFLYVFSIGPYVSYMALCLACTVIPIIFFCSLFWMPESPYYLIAKCDHKSSIRALQKLRGKSADGVKEEVQIIQSAVDESLRNEGSWKDLFTQKANFKALYLMCGLMAVQQFSGINVVLFYSQTIFTKAGSTFAPEICTIIVGLVMFIASFGAPFLIETLGRRLVIIISAVGMMLAQGVLGGQFYLESIGYDVSKMGWVGAIPLTAIIIYITVYSVGIGPVPWAMLGEMFAPSIRSKGAAFSASFSWFLAFLMTKFYGSVAVMLGAHVAFWLFASSCGIGAIFVYFCLPETKGKTLQEIQDILNS